MSKTILVLGASIHQLPVIRAAKSKSLVVHVADNVPDNPGHNEADFSHDLDTTDTDAILALALDWQFDGVIAPCTDVAVPSAAIVSSALGLPGIPQLAAEIVTGKLSFREFQYQKGFDHPSYSRIKSTETNLSSTQYGAGIIKPDQSSGSKGAIITNPSDPDFLEHIQTARKFSQNNTVIYEEFVDGHQGTIEGVIIEGEIKLAFFLDRQVAAPPHVCTYGHNMPTKLSSDTKNFILQNVKRLWTLLEVSNAVFDVDFVWDGEKVYILEMSPRLGGNSISGLVRYSTDVDLVSIAIDFALGKAPAIDHGVQENVSAVILLGLLESGVVSIDAQQMDEIRTLDWVSNIEIYVSPGDTITPFINGHGCLARMFISAKGTDELNSRIEYIRNQRLFNIVDSVSEAVDDKAT